MSKTILYEDEARQAILRGAEKLYEPVSKTMGPKGRNVVIDYPGIGPQTTHDGVTVARAVDLDESNLGERTGAELIKNAASLMNDEVGDGTTTVTVLVYHLLKELNRQVTGGVNAMVLKRQLDELLIDVIDALKSLANEEVDLKTLESIATVSAGDKELGKLIAGVVHEVGVDGSVVIEASGGEKDTVEMVSGYTFDGGFTVPHMANNKEFTKASYSDIPVLVTDKKISYANELIPLLNSMHQKGKKELVIVAPEVDGEALVFLIHNRQQGQFNVLAVNAPGVGELQKDYLADIAAVTGARVISQSSGDDIQKATMEDLGKASKVIATKEKTSILTEESKQLTEWIDGVRKRLHDEGLSEHIKKQLTERVATLEGRVATIKATGSTPQQVEEKKFRIEDAVMASKAAIAEGIVVGGGVTLLMLSLALMAKDEASRAVQKAFEQPFLKLMENAGLNGQALIEKVKVSEAGSGVDVQTGKIVDMVKAGIIDPLKATRQAIETSFGVAGLAITMGALIVETPKKERN